jgi:hypothetical protein
MVRSERFNAAAICKSVWLAHTARTMARSVGVNFFAPPRKVGSLGPGPGTPAATLMVYRDAMCSTPYGFAAAIGPRRGIVRAGNPDSAPGQLVAVCRVTAAFESVRLHVPPDRSPQPSPLAILL